MSYEGEDDPMVVYGRTYDNITGEHHVTFGKPKPTDTVDAGVMFDTIDQWVFDLKDYPFEDLPSGGASNRCGPSEVCMAELWERNYTPQGDSTKFTWTKSGFGIIPDKVLYEGYGEEYNEGSDTSYVSWDFSFIGFFGWEINEAGDYFVIIDADGGRGSARIDFQVIDTRPPLEISTSNVGFSNGTTYYETCTLPGSYVGTPINVKFDWSTGANIKSISGIVVYAIDGVNKYTPFTYSPDTIDSSGWIVVICEDLLEAGKTYSNLTLTSLTAIRAG